MIKDKYIKKRKYKKLYCIIYIYVFTYKNGNTNLCHKN